MLKKSPLKKNENGKSSHDEYEIACEAADEIEEPRTDDDGHAKIGIMTETDKKFMIRVNGKEETPCITQIDKDTKTKKSKCRLSIFKSQTKESENTNNNETVTVNSNKKDSKPKDDSDGNNNSDDKVDCQIKYSTLPMVNRQKHKRTIAIPQRTTSDGTRIFYLCDLPKKIKKGFFLFHKL